MGRHQPQRGEYQHDGPVVVRQNEYCLANIPLLHAGDCFRCLVERGFIDYLPSGRRPEELKYDFTVVSVAQKTIQILLSSWSRFASSCAALNKQTSSSTQVRRGQQYTLSQEQPPAPWSAGRGQLTSSQLLDHTGLGLSHWSCCAIGQTRKSW